MPVTAMRCLLDGDLDAASQSARLSLPSFFLQEGWLWDLRLRQLAQDPAAADWVVRAAVAEDRAVVGHAGFHGPPDALGAVEVGYTVVPELRGRGWAKACLAALVARAKEEPQVTLVRASVAPDNVASLAVVRGAGLTYVGEAADEDGVELVFELALTRSPTDRGGPRGGSGTTQQT